MNQPLSSIADASGASSPAHVVKSSAVTTMLVWLIAALFAACTTSPSAPLLDAGPPDASGDVRPYDDSAAPDAGAVRPPTGVCTAVFDPLNEDRTLLRCDGLYVIQSSDTPAEPRQLRSVPRHRLVALISPKEFGRPNAPFQMFLPDAEGTHPIDEASSRASVERRLQFELDRRTAPAVEPFVTAGTVSLAGAQITELYESARVRYDSVNPTARSVAVLAHDASGRLVFRRILRADPDPILRRFWFTPGNRFTRGITQVLGPEELTTAGDVVDRDRVCRPQARLYTFGATIFSPLQGFGDLARQRAAAMSVDRDTYVLLQFIEVLDVTLALLSDLSGGAFSDACTAEAIHGFVADKVAEISAQLASGRLDPGDSFKNELLGLVKDALVGCSVGALTSAIAQRTCTAVATGAAVAATPAAGFLVRAVCALGPTLARVSTRGVSATLNDAFAQRDLPLESETCASACTLYCTPGRTRCGLVAFEECDASGCGWRSRQRCECGCTSSGCTAPACAPSARRCSPDGRQAEVCHPSGCRWMSDQNCACGCADGRCTDRVCVPGTRECDDRSVRECLPTGCGWRTLPACPAGSRCIDRECRGCGGAGEPCCAGADRCGAGLVCDASSRCARCAPSCEGRCGGASDGCGGRCDTPCPTPRAVRVVAPNGGETWDVGTRYAIRWSASGGVSAVRVELVEGAVAVELLDPARASGADGASLDFTPLARHAGRSFRVRVSAVGDGAAQDTSDGTFRVQAVAPCAGDPLIGAPCEVGRGLCRRTATYACTQGARQCPAQAAAPSAEVCGNGVDEDCDGADAQCPRPCAGDPRIGAACTAGDGACARGGLWVCRGGMTVCDATPGAPSTEYCNGIDDDCDRETDEGASDVCYSGPAGTLGVGVCRAGRATCVGGMLGACVGDVRPSAEVCGNGVDENCDGRDEACVSPCAGDPRVGTSCSVGRGACERAGAWACRGGVTVCDATPGAPAPESCANRVDDDCDGTVDCGDPDCASDAACRVCMYNGCFDRGLSSGGYCDGRVRVACGVASGCAVEVGRTDCETRYPHALGSCFGGSCLLGSGSCERAWGDCDGDDANGCETNLDTSVAHCGVCGRACASPTGAVACVAGACSITACPPGRANCDGELANGCEQDIAANDFNCGACRAMCGPGASCVASACRCPAGATYCAAGCVDVQTDARHCGACGNACGAGTRCVAGACTSACGAGRTDCSGACVDLQADVGHCGACHRACAWRANAVPTCAAATCGQTCNAGFGDCDGDASNGCERDLRGDAANCGACGRACGAGVACSIGVCGSDPVEEVTNGRIHACVRRRSGRVVCWGANGGALGNGTPFASVSPVPVTGMTDARQITAGEMYTCALRATGEVACWGVNGSGTVGDGTTTARLVPTSVAGVRDAVEVAGGWNHVCARLRSGAVVCWGYNSDGQLGDGTTLRQLTPVAVTGLTDAVELAAGRGHTCARRASGAVVCWGGNYAGQLGNGNNLAQRTPVAVTGLTDAVELAAGSAHTCVRRASGAIVCWGENDFGQLGNGTQRRSNVPVTAPLAASVTLLACGEGHTCALTVDQRVVCWGRNGEGQLGDATGANRTTPGPVVPLASVVWVSTGQTQTCAVQSSGGAYCWGSGPLGDGTTSGRSSPTPVAGL